MRAQCSILAALILAGCFAPPFPDAPVAGSGHGKHVVRGGSPDDAHGSDHAAAALAQGFVVDGACFDVRVPGDAEGSVVKGFLYHPPDWSERTRVVTILPGGASLAHVFDGEQIGYGRDNGTTLPRALARSGYAALVIDRLGLGQSPYAGSGARLTQDVHVEVTHQIVAGLRAGSYARTLDPHADCPGSEPAPHSSASVVLGGHSLGGWLTMTYVGLHDDVDGAFVLAAHRGGLNEEFLRKITTCVASQQPEDYPLVLCPGAAGYSPTCMEHFFHWPSADRAVAEAFCDNDELHGEPIGVFSEAMWLAAGPTTIANVPPIPVHFTFMENDLAIGGGTFEGLGPSRNEREVAQWRTLCACTVTEATIPEMGHVFQFHRNHHLVTEDVLAWLAASGLTPEA